MALLKLKNVSRSCLRFSMLSNCLKHCFEQQRDIWCKGSSDAKVLAFFSAKSEWRETTRRFRPLQTAAVGLSGVYVNEACMLKFGAEFNCGVPVRMKPNGFLCSRTGTWIGEIFIQ